ncbi:MAG: AMP-binding protein [Candidatus Thiodiazotropha sp.]
MMLLSRLAEHAKGQPQRLAIQGSELSLNYADLQTQVLETMARFSAMGIKSLALDLDNGPVWAVLDLAALGKGIGLVPIPPFFSNRQVRHALIESGVGYVITDNPEAFRQRATGETLSEIATWELCGKTLTILRPVQRESRIPAGIVKVTFTSGTTAEPKGVLLDRQQMEAVILALAERVPVQDDDRHLVLTPLSVLLENIAGLYLPLWCGASVALPSLLETGLLGASGLNSRMMLAALESYRASSAIFSPQMLQGAVRYLQQTGAQVPRDLRFIALGGAAVSKRLLDRAATLGIPVYEGYGLSESASVVTLNAPQAHRPGSVGRPLSHLEVRIAEDGEVLIRGTRFAGYLGEPTVPSRDGWWHTGDLGYLDDEGYLYLRGRRRHVFITAYGRNVSPEWVERELVLEPEIAQAAVFGEARPWNLAVIVPSGPIAPNEIEAAITRVNETLPDYARVSQWFFADTPFTPTNSQLSGTGRLRRDTIHQHYQSRIEALFDQELAS